MSNDTHKGTILEFRGSWGSGLGYLIIKDSETGIIESIPCDNGITVRSLEAAFGNVIGPNHMVDNINGGHRGQEIFYSYDEMRICMDGFTPVNEASLEMIGLYEETE